jgi:hypothetical protein
MLFIDNAVCLKLRKRRKIVRRILCGFLGDSETKRAGGKRSLPLLWFLFPAIFFFLAPLDGTAQTAEAEAEVKPDAVVVVMPVKADEGLQAGGFQNGIAGTVNSISGYTARVRTLGEFPEYANAFPNAAPAPAYVQDSSFALTSEYYRGMDNRQHFQVWLWNSADGAPLFTDEMVFGDIEEGMGYLPGLVSWVMSLIPEETGPSLTRKEVREIAQAVLNESGITAWEYSWFWWYVGLRGGGALNSYTIRSSGGYAGNSERGFDAEVALSLEVRPWRYLSFQTEAVLLVEAFNTFKDVNHGVTGTQDYIPAKVASLSLLVPLLLKFPFDVERFGLSFSLGPYLILPLTSAGGLLENVTGRDAVFFERTLPFGLCFGIDIGYRLGGGELFGGLHYNYDLTMAAAPVDGPYAGLELERQRLAITFGYRIGFIETGGAKRSGDLGTVQE